MRKVIIAATIASIALAAPAAHADEWGGLVGGLAGGLIAGAIASSMQPHTVYVPVERRHHVAPRPRAPAPTRVVVVHDRPAPVAVPVPATCRFRSGSGCGPTEQQQHCCGSGSGPGPDHHQQLSGSGSGSDHRQRRPGSLGSDSDSGSVPAGLREDRGLPRLPEGRGCEVKRPKREAIALASQRDALPDEVSLLKQCGLRSAGAHLGNLIRELGRLIVRGSGWLVAGGSAVAQQEEVRASDRGSSHLPVSAEKANRSCQTSWRERQP